MFIKPRVHIWFWISRVGVISNLLRLIEGQYLYMSLMRKESSLTSQFFFIFRMFSNKEESIASDATSCFSGRRLLHTTQSFSLDKTYLFFRILIRRTNTANSIYFMFLHLTLEFCIHHHLMCFRHLISQYQHWDRGLDLTKFWSKSDPLCFQKAYAF